MKTLNHHTIKVYAILLLNLFALNLSAQQTDENEARAIQLDTVSIVANQQSFENLVCDIVLDENFEYRKALRKSKTTKKQYVFTDLKISEANLLKHFKKAARKSESVDDFLAYFYKRDLNFIDLLNGKDITSLYLTFRKGTLNSYLQELESAFGSI